MELDLSVLPRTGIPEYSNEKISFYPNPTSDFIYVSKKSNTQLFDIHGRLLKEYLQTDLIDMREYYNGIYFLKANDNRTVKVVKK